jgi:hypothetical protein
LLISATGASITARDFCRDLPWPSRLAERTEAVVRNRAADSFGPWSIINKTAYPGSTMLLKVIGDNPDVLLIGGDAIWNASITFADHGVQTPAQQQADVAAMQADFTAYVPFAKQVYVSMPPPATFTLGGVTYTVAGSNYAALDAYCKTLWPNNITLNYADVYATLGSIDGTHPAFGAGIFLGNDAAWELQALGFNMGLPLADYAPYDGSGGSAAILANIRARNALGMAIIDSLNLRLT